MPESQPLGHFRHFNFVSIHARSFHRVRLYLIDVRLQFHPLHAHLRKQGLIFFLLSQVMKLIRVGLQIVKLLRVPMIIHIFILLPYDCFRPPRREVSVGLGQERRPPARPLLDVYKRQECDG